MQERPQVIYKYTDMIGLEYILQDQTLKFSCPFDTNDLFECDISLLDFDFTGPITPLVASEIAILKHRFKLDNDPVLWQERYKKGQLAKIKSSKIFSCSLSNNEDLMWSHYSGNHMGVCLEFDNMIDRAFVNLDSDKDISEGVVVYEAHKSINYVAEDRDYAMFKVFFNKSEKWSYEKEYRLLTLNDKDEFQKFNPNFLQSITFGVKVTDEEIHSIVKAIDKNLFGHLKYYKSKKNYLSLQFTQLEL